MHTVQSHCIPIFVQDLTSAEYMNSSWSIRPNTHLWYQTVSSKYGANIDGRMLDKTVCVADNNIP
jgi:hypothetical protein